MLTCQGDAGGHTLGLPGLADTATPEPLWRLLDDAWLTGALQQAEGQKRELGKAEIVMKQQSNWHRVASILPDLASSPLAGRARRSLPDPKFTRGGRGEVAGR